MTALLGARIPAISVEHSEQSQMVGCWRVLLFQKFANDFPLSLSCNTVLLYFEKTSGSRREPGIGLLLAAAA